MSLFDTLRRVFALIVFSTVAAEASAAGLQAVAPVRLPNHGVGVDGPFFPRTRVAPVAPTTGTALQQQAQLRLEVRLGANTVLSNGAAVTKAQAQSNNLGFIAKHFDEIDSAHTGRISMNDVRQYLQRKQRQ
ncbi:2-oxoglutarate dehydrogenase [Trinickia sp. LjRoot230]|uniref:2-oxoglutarate dehydrogenase n=1 Tax=Trinickia sp. LjRoot230 TaxID=3342288 RepID=UPI003ECFB938